MTTQDTNTTTLRFGVCEEGALIATSHWFLSLAEAQTYARTNTVHRGSTWLVVELVLHDTFAPVLPTDESS